MRKIWFVMLMLLLPVVSYSIKADTITPTYLEINIVGGSSITKTMSIKNTGSSAYYYINTTILPDSQGINVSIPASVYVAGGSERSFDFTISTSFYIEPKIYDIYFNISKLELPGATTRRGYHVVVMPVNNTVPIYPHTSYYTLTIIYHNCGNVIKNPSLESYPNGTTVKLTALPCYGFTFTGYIFEHFPIFNNSRYWWNVYVNDTGYFDNTNKTIDILMDSNKTIDVYFMPGRTEQQFPFIMVIIFIILIIFVLLIYTLIRRNNKGERK